MADFGTLLSALLVCLLFSTVQCASTFRSGSVYCRDRQCAFADKFDTQLATAVGTFNDTLYSTGWGILDLSAGYAKHGRYSNEDLMYGAGFLEGVFTASHIEAHFANLQSTFIPKPGTEKYNKVKGWLSKQRAWTNMMIEQHREDSPLWRHMGYIQAQLDGLYAGYRSVRNTTSALEKIAFDLLNGVGDLLDLLKVLSPDSFPDLSKLSRHEAMIYFYSQGHCSALIKVLPGFENIFMSHSSWFLYQATNRIFKHYNFNVKDAYTATKKVSFSSYPGFLESLDDFYMMDSGLVMLQTTINIYNTTLFRHVTPQSLLAWQRVRLANMMARTGEEWTQIIAKYNSGTYNNEYMVIDLNRFQPGKQLPDGTLWVANQIPGQVVAGDETQILRTGYFPSYNVPFFEEAFNKSGYPAYVKSHGVDFSYQLAPRAKIFRRDADKVSNMTDMKHIMRYNDYKNDKYGAGNPWNAICSRGDLDKTGPRPDGCYDTKVTDYFMAKNLKADIINGPTLGTGLAPFSWAGNFSQFSHVGLPKSYQFGFLTTQPQLDIPRH